MSTNATTIAATPDEVWAVLADGWLYPLFVVGASRMRAVDRGWPAVGTRLHHSAGSWPALIDDDTEVLECEPPARLRLRARGWPLGEAEVTFHLESQGSGTRVVLEEDVVGGPGTLLPKPLRDPQLAWRNTETLTRLRFVVEGRR
jgi:uncharacterized protein YndB with AHSA1/START domain